MVKLTILQQTEKKTFALSGTNITNSTVKYQHKDDTITVNLSGVEREYCQKDSKSYNMIIQEYNKTRKNDLLRNNSILYR